MVFSSFFFLFVFFPFSVTGYFLTPEKYRNFFLLLSSYIFYLWGAPQIAPLLLALSFFDYALSMMIEEQSKLSLRKRKILLTLGIAINLSLLFYYKYWIFFLKGASSLFTQFGFQGVHWETIVLPIGISFFTFQKISYLVDIYRGTAKRASSFTEYALYVALFPQLIAGPIVRYHEIATQLQERSCTWRSVSSGLTRFSFGLAKKVLIADYLAQVADAIFLLQDGELTTPYAWLGILAYTFQIYFDFSGYSDMAIGIGKIFGFSFPENFNNPYIAKSFRDFWSRWHMTLSNWMKEYLYIPLGGNKVSSLKMIRNLWVVFLLSGLWHGASWNFVLWGAYHGFFLTLERFLPLGSSPYRVIVIFPLLVLSWVLFRAVDLSQAIFFYEHLFALQDASLTKPIAIGELAQNRDIAMLCVASFLSFFPLFQKKKEKSYSGSIQMTLAYALLLLSLMALAGIDYTPFLYFRF